MGTVCVKAPVRIILGLFLIASVAAVSTAGQDDTVSALILTTDGRLAEGELMGIDPTIRLDASGLTNYVGPAQAFDISRARIHQITLDFPRLVVETGDRVYVGPFSAFSGISELLVLHQGTKRLSIPTASVRAIALHGTPLHPVPREWLGSAFLVMPLPAARSALKLEGEEMREPFITPTQEPSPEGAVEPEQETPWWLGVLIIVALVALVYVGLGLGGG